jgi:hypothetical protein
MRRNGSPALFIALDGLHGSSQQLSHLRLVFTQLVTNIVELVSIHRLPRYYKMAYIIKKHENHWENSGTA